MRNHYRKKGWIHSKILDSLMAWLGEKRKTEFSWTQANQAMSESRIFERIQHFSLYGMRYESPRQQKVGSLLVTLVNFPKAHATSNNVENMKKRHFLSYNGFRFNWELHPSLSSAPLFLSKERGKIVDLNWIGCMPENGVFSCFQHCFRTSFLKPYM